MSSDVGLAAAAEFKTWPERHAEAQRLANVMRATATTDRETFNRADNQYIDLWIDAVEQASLENQAAELVPILHASNEGTPVFHAANFAELYRADGMHRWLRRRADDPPGDVARVAAAVGAWRIAAPSVLRALFRVRTAVVRAQDYPQKPIDDAIHTLVDASWLEDYLYEPVILTIVQAAKQVLNEDHPDFAVDWHHLWEQLPSYFISDSNLPSHPELEDFFKRFVLTPEELVLYQQAAIERERAEAEAEELNERVVALEAKLAPLPDPTLVEQAQLFVAALAVAYDADLAHDYYQLLNSLLKNVTLKSQSDLLLYFPTLQQLQQAKSLQNFMQTYDLHDMYSGMMVRALLLRPPTEKWTAENVALYQQYDGHLLRYVFVALVLSTGLAELSPQQNMINILVRYLERGLFEVLAVAARDVPGRKRLYFAQHGLLDDLLAWTIEQAEYALHHELADVLAVAAGDGAPAVVVPANHLDHIFLRRTLGTYDWIVDPKTDDFLPGLYPKLSALLQPEWRAFQLFQQQQHRQQASHALRQRLRARRRLSLAFLPAPTIAALTPPSLSPSLFPPPLAFRSHRRRRPSSSSSYTLSAASPAPAVRAFLLQQQEAEEKQLATLPVVPPAIRQWAQRRASVRSAALARGLPVEQVEQEVKQQVPSFRNCVDFGTRRCSNNTNLAGFDWCHVPETWWWGPIGRGRECSDIRELLVRFAQQAIDIPSIPRPSHQFTYPNGAPLSDNFVKSMVEIARAQDHPVPWELQNYFTGKAAQQQAPKAAEERRFRARELRRLQEATPYAAVATALSAQEAQISREIQRGYAGFENQEEEEASSESEED